MSIVCERKVWQIHRSANLWLQWAVFVAIMGLVRCYECGGFVDLQSAGTGTFTSPGYPGNYPNYTRCIWILEAPAGNVPQLTVDFVGETYNSECSDYVEFRDGGQSDTVLLKSCATLTSQVVTSTSRWMYVYFHSDGFSQVNGLSATYADSSVASTNSSISSPISTCRSYEFTCANKLCLSISYRCDGYNDCGCGKECDEDGCEGLEISDSESLGIGISVGIVVFVVACGAGLLLEKHHNWENKHGEQGPGRRRTGWAPGKGKQERKKSSYSPAEAKPRINSCTIKVSEVV